VKTVSWSEGNHVFATANDGFKDSDNSKLSIFRFPSDYSFIASKHEYDDDNDDYDDDNFDDSL